MPQVDKKNLRTEIFDENRPRPWRQAARLLFSGISRKRQAGRLSPRGPANNRGFSREKMV